jgi:L-alanine-DL-glutamate epimerase-like enolase superfamily enzyme
MRIVDIVEASLPISSTIRNAWIDFTTMDCSIVAVVSDVVRDGKPVVGYGFNSNGRYSQGEIIRRRLVPRLLGAAPEDLLGDGGDLDPERAWAVMMRNEKPGGHGERSVAVGVLDMALFDLVAKVADVPLWQWLADHYGDGTPDPDVAVYAAGGYYAPGKGIAALENEVRGFLDAGYTRVKIKIGGATLAEDLRRIEAVLTLVGAGSALAVDANGRFDLETALSYARALEPYGLAWYEEPSDPLDYLTSSIIASSYPGALATGENLFSCQDAQNLVRYGGVRPDRDILQFDPALSYGLVEYLRTLEMLDAHGWSRRSLIPHGGHQFAVHIAAALHLGGNESYPGEFAPAGGFADGAVVVGGRLALSDAPGVGLEEKAAFYAALRALHE